MVSQNVHSAKNAVWDGQEKSSMATNMTLLPPPALRGSPKGNYDVDEDKDNDECYYKPYYVLHFLSSILLSSYQAGDTPTPAGRATNALSLREYKLSEFSDQRQWGNPLYAQKAPCVATLVCLSLLLGG